ncbi:MAG: hypothetical protein V2I25_15125 [Woeseiaceae bacterium]|jgi:hypothetical protein|nr:hypothetical protein [Woeseiaceae bacterium]
MLRKRKTELSLLIVAGFLAGCASTPSSDNGVTTGAAAADGAAASEAAPAEPKVVQTTAQAKKYATEEQIEQARRECMRKLRRVTGSRIPRDACQGSAGLYSGAYNQVQEGAGQGEGAALPSN